MNPRTLPLPEGATEEVSALIETLDQTGRRLEDLTQGEVDSVTNRDGRVMTLRHAQDQLRHSEAARQTAILNALPANIALLDTEGVIVSVNEAWRRFAGGNGIHGIGVNYLDICDSIRGSGASAARQVAEGIRSVLDGGVKTFSLEYPCHSPTEQRWFQMTATPLSDNHPNGAVVMHMDVTTEKQADEELRRSENLKGAILESSLDCIITIDHEGKIAEFNPAAEAAFGLTRGQALGKVMVDLIVPPRLRDAHSRGFAHYLATGSGPILGKRIELEAVRADGTEFPIELAITAIGATSKPMFTGFIRDITARKEADTKIKRLNRLYAVFSRINALIVRAHDQQHLFQESCRIAVEEGQFPFAWIGVLDPATQDITPVAWAGENAEELTRAKSSARDDTPRGKGAVGQAIRQRCLVFNNDIAARSFGGPREKEILRLGFRSQITLPLFEGQTVVGTLTMYAREPNFFDNDESRLLTELAEDISFALENISRQQKLDKLARIRAVSSEINAAIIRIQDREALLRETCRIAVEYGKFEMVWIALLDHEKQTVRPIAWAGFSRDAAHAVTWASINAVRGTLGAAMTTRKPAVRNDIETELSPGNLRQEALQKGYLSTVCVPLVVHDKVESLISLFAPGVDFFNEEELALLNEAAANVSFALQSVKKQERLEYLSYYDLLTGLANRSLFLERVAQYMRSAVTGKHKLALFLIDLERFKNINDSLGQPAGDELLRQVAQWLTRNAGDANLLARVGADHFAVVLPEVRQEGNVARLVEKTMQAFSDHPFHLDDAVFRISAKLGIALFPDDGGDAETLFRNAEAALKKAKVRGDRYLFHMQQMTATVAGKLTLENQLRQALDKEEFVLHYQPKVSLVSGKLTSAEALIRWNDPRTGLVPPNRFIPVLEETGLIYEVGRWALRKAIEDYLRWRTAGLTAVRIAVNVSPLQLRNRGFIAEIQQAISIDPYAAAGLELEITESVIMEDIKHSIAILQAIRAMGIYIAIDDFGTGFSSLSYLSKLPVDTLKIDRSFVSDMTVGPEGLALVSTIITLAHALNLCVVAEGVETEEQSRLLRLVRCDEMQGYLFSKPVPVEDFEARFLALPTAV